MLGKAPEVAIKKDEVVLCLLRQRPGLILKILGKVMKKLTDFTRFKILKQFHYVFTFGKREATHARVWLRLAR